jgi:hypothetical protein
MNYFNILKIFMVPVYRNCECVVPSTSIPKYMSDSEVQTPRWWLGERETQRSRLPSSDNSPSIKKFRRQEHAHPRDRSRPHSGPCLRRALSCAASGHPEPGPRIARALAQIESCPCVRRGGLPQARGKRSGPFRRGAARPRIPDEAPSLQAFSAVHPSLR